MRGFDKTYFINMICRNVYLAENQIGRVCFEVRLYLGEINQAFLASRRNISRGLLPKQLFIVRDIKRNNKGVIAFGFEDSVQTDINIGINTVQTNLLGQRDFSVLNMIQTDGVEFLRIIT